MTGGVTTTTTTAFLVGSAAALLAAGGAFAQTTQSGVGQTTPLPSAASPADNFSGGPPGPLPEQVVADASSAATQTYGLSFFTPFGDQNAEDMVRHLPGAQQILDVAGQMGQTRGLGSGGDQILLNGKRMAAKGQITNALRRIPASSVAQIELIRGNSEKVDVLSDGLLINIVLKPGASVGGGVGSYEITAKFDNKDWNDFDGLLSYSGAFHGLNYVLGFERNAWTPLGATPTGGPGDYSRRFRDERYFYPNGAVQELRPQKWKRDHGKQIWTANLNYEFANGDQIRFNALYQLLPVIELDDTDYTRFSLAGVATNRGREHHERTRLGHTYDFGGEYEKRIGTGVANLIVIHTFGDTELLDYRYRVEGPVLTEVARSRSYQDTGEDIVRGSYAWPVFKGQTLTLGAEGAKNTLAQDLNSFADPLRTGRLSPLDLAGAGHAEVEELRGEAFAIHNWKITSRLTLESSISLETSKITTNFRFIPVAKYTFPKPRFDLRYQATPADRLRFKIERTVSQLDFNNFVPIFNQVDNRVDAGNPTIAPEKTWIYEAAYERRLGAAGSAEARGFYRDITDHIDRGPFGVNSQGLIYSTPINIPKAKLYGLEAKTSVKLGRLGMPNVQVNSRWLRQKSEVIDPFTGRERKMKDPYNGEFNIGVRHDLPRQRAFYGVNVVDTQGAQLLSDVRNLEYYKRNARYDAYLEKALFGQVSIRFEAYNLTGSKEFKQRTLYTVSQANGAVLRSETYEETRDRRFAIRLRGKF